MPALHHYQETNPRLGTPSGLSRERSLRAYDGVVNVVGEPKSRDFRLSKPSPTRWSKRGLPLQPQVDDSIDREIRVRDGHAGIPFEADSTSGCQHSAHDLRACNKTSTPAA